MVSQTNKGFNGSIMIAGPDSQQQAIFGQGHEVGALARQSFPGGIEIAGSSDGFDEILAASKQVSPDMLEFWLRQARREPDTRKIVVLEDAEELLVERGADNREKVSKVCSTSPTGCWASSCKCTCSGQ